MYIKDVWDFLRKLPQEISFNATMSSCSITSLYISIPIDIGLEAISYWFDKKENKYHNVLQMNL